MVFVVQNYRLGQQGLKKVIMLGKAQNLNLII